MNSKNVIITDINLFFSWKDKREEYFGKSKNVILYFITTKVYHRDLAIIQNLMYYVLRLAFANPRSKQGPPKGHLK